MRERFRNTPWPTVLSEGPGDPPAITPFEAVYGGYRRVPDAPGTGKIGVLLFPQYVPTSDLVYKRQEDIVGSTDRDESVRMPDESWPRSKRPPLVNFGGNRVGIVGEPLMFDATLSQLDEDELPTRYRWTIDGQPVGEHSLLTYTFAAPGLYVVSCTIGVTTGSRYVRILNAWGESDFDVTAVGSLSGSVDAGWTVSLEVRDELANNELVPFQGIMLYVYDGLDQAWRRQYESKMRAIDRRIKSSHELPPDPLWQTAYIGWKEGEDTYHVYTEAPVNPQVLLQGCWPAVDIHLDAYLQAQAKYGVPANLGRALACELTAGNRTYPFGRQRFAATGAEHVRQGMLALGEAYRDCGGSWPKAARRFIDGVCPDDDTIPWNTTIGRVFDAWAQLDNAGGVGSAITARRPDVPQAPDVDVPVPADVLFFGYVDALAIREDANTTVLQLTLVNSAQMLTKTFQRLEAYWESTQHAIAGGTTMEGPPMRSATCVHHLLTAHTNFAAWHDVILDWSGPRLWSTTAPEGPTWNAIAGWAGNDYAWAYASRTGQLRYLTRPHYKGSQWYAEAIKEAIRIDPEHLIDIQVQELRMLKRTAYTRLCGTTRGGNCEICGEFPCGGPPANSPGEWAIKRGLQYDDYRTLCRFAAYDFAYQNRSFDLQIALPWRHDLDLGDLFFLPLDDPQGRFRWTLAAAPVFVIKAISHAYDTASARWITTIQAEQLTYGVACDCDNATCPTTVDDGLCSGDIGCDLVVEPEEWKIETVSRTIGDRIVANVTTRNGALTTFGVNEQTTTIYGKAARTVVESAAAASRAIVVNPRIPVLEPRMTLTTTRYRADSGTRLSRNIEIVVPRFTVKAKGPVGGTVTVDLRFRAKQQRRAYLHVFYRSSSTPVMSETDDYADGQQVLVTKATPLRDAPDPTLGVTLTTLPVDMLLTVTGVPMKVEKRTFYPVVADIGEFGAGDRAQVARDDTEVRATPSFSSGFIGTLEAGVIATVLDRQPATDELWYQVQTPTVTGWLLREDLRYLTGWVEVTALRAETGDDNPVVDAQLLIAPELRQTLDSFTPKKATEKLRRFATIEQFDYRLRDTRTSEYVDELKLKLDLPTKETSAVFVIGVMVTSEYGGESWRALDPAPTQSIEAWVNESTLDNQYGVCECDALQLSTLPLIVQQAVAALGTMTVTEYARLRETLCVLFPPRYCLESSRVDPTTYEVAVANLAELEQLSGREIVFIETETSRIGASASLDVQIACRNCVDPLAGSQNNDNQDYGPRPSIFIHAGHAHAVANGSSEERDLNVPLARTYAQKFREAGYPVFFWQEVDGDSNNDRSPGTYQDAYAALGQRMAQTEGQLILLDIHHEGGPSTPGVFVIVPDCGTDTIPNNPDDVNLARTLAKNLSNNTGLVLRSGLFEPGVMSEQSTGVGCRLAVFASTANVRERAARVVIEHGNLSNTGDRNIIYGAGFRERAAMAAVNAVNQLYPSNPQANGCPNWPTLGAIQAELGRTLAGSRKSPMQGLAQEFLTWGSQYRINPAFVLALCYSESQYGTDGQLSLNANNYGGHKAANSNDRFAGCGTYSYIGQLWNKYCSPREGAEALFRFLDKDIYRRTNGTIKAIIDIYTPTGSENSSSTVDRKYQIIADIGSRLGVRLARDTIIYTDLAQCTTAGQTPTPTPTPGNNFGGYSTMFQQAFMSAGAAITQFPFQHYSHSRCDCYDFGVPMRTPVYPIVAGTVRVAERVDDAYRPYKIVIETRFGRLVYAHLDSINVKVGTQVALDTMIGRTGTCCDNIYGGPHLHIGLEGGKAASAGGQYTLTDIFKEAGIDLAKFARR